MFQSAVARRGVWFTACMFRAVDADKSLPRVIDPDDPSRRRPPHEMAHLALFLTPEELEAVERLAARSGMSAGEFGLRALAYGLTVLEATQRQVERDRPKVN